MNLINGKLVESKDIEKYMIRLENRIYKTLEKPLLSHNIVIDACEKLMESISDEYLYNKIKEVGLNDKEIGFLIKNLRTMFSKEYLSERVLIELGKDYGNCIERKPLDVEDCVYEQIYPLGVLCHIAAGNMDALPVYSVVEGLLTGNINLLKLPSVDGGLTVDILKRLCDIEPILKEYIYVFELSSKDIKEIGGLIELSDAVVVWGGDMAISAIRQIAPPNTRIIEWGHKLSFCYVTEKGATRENLEGIAYNICLTNQVLCSSAQGIFYESDSYEESFGFCKKFLEILEEKSKDFGNITLEARAQSQLILRSKKLEKINGAKIKIFKGEKTSVIFEKNNELCPSMQFRNIWVKQLKRNEIVKHLHKHKNHLQTVGLVCGDDEWEEIRDLLWRSGVVRVSSGREMSNMYCGSNHDGEYPLRRYTRVVSGQRM